MKKKRLRTFVIPSLYLFVVSIILICILFVGAKYNKGIKNFDLAVTSIFKDNITSVIAENEEVILKPFNSDKVEINKNYYDRESTLEEKENSIIYFENTYMQNTGILYSSDEEFEVLSVLPGKVTSILEDELLGKVIYVEYNTNTTIAYYSLDNLNYKVGDEVAGGAVLGVASSNKIENEKKYNLLFEVYINGNLINPNKFFTMNINDLNE